MITETHSLIAFLASFVTVLITLGCYVTALKALRAKRRVHYFVKMAALHDASLRAVARRVTAKSAVGDIAEAIKMIEASTRSLSQEDRRLLEQGMHQSSTRGAERFVREVLRTAA